MNCFTYECHNREENIGRYSLYIAILSNLSGYGSCVCGTEELYLNVFLLFFALHYVLVHYLLCSAVL